MKLLQLIAGFKHARKKEPDVVTMTAIDFCDGFIDTVEGCALQGDVFQAVEQVFKEFPPDVRYSLLFTPKAAGGWAGRARFWQSVLKRTLPPRQYYIAMRSIYGAYRHALRVRKELIANGQSWFL